MSLNGGDLCVVGTMDRALGWYWMTKRWQGIDRWV